MYTKFFGLNEKPFAITPDPRYLFKSERHDEGLAHLVYGVTESGGFIQLTGEVGTGKTTLVRTLLGQLPDEVDVALILNPQLTAVEFLLAICDELKIARPKKQTGTKTLVDSLNTHLLQAHAGGRRTILLVDEAQNLSTDVLEQIRLLTNLETAKQKLLQIILIAQPELRDKLDSTELRQLAQRVTGRCHLEPLSKEETGKYIEHRLKVAGALGEIFNDGAKREVFRLSGGVPRLINVFCDRALLGAYSRDFRIVNRTLVRKAAQEVSGKGSAPRFLRWVVPGALVLGLAVTTIWLLSKDASQHAVSAAATTPAIIEAAPQVVARTPEAAPAPQEAPPTQDQLALNDALHSSVSSNNRASAMLALSELWDINFDASTGANCAQAEAQGLKCLSQSGTWTVLRQLDRPVVLTLTDSDGNNFRTALVSIEGESAELVIGGSRMTFSLQEISDLWFGEYLLLWRPPIGNTTLLQRGMRGDSVRWLRDSLSAINPGYDSRSVDVDLFDEDLEAQLRDFQRRNRLKVDGVAGQQTLIIINSRLVQQGTPRLTAG